MATERKVDHAARERAIAALEREQYGVVSIGQLREVGLSDNAARSRVRRDRRQRVSMGVHANPSVERDFKQRVMAAVLAGGDGVFASHECAAQLWGLPGKGVALVEITSGLNRRPGVAGVTCHRSGHEGDTTMLGAIPIATPERTIVDLSGRLDTRSLGKIVDEALRTKLTTLMRLREVTLRLCPAPGRSLKKMLTVLDRRDERVGDRESLLEDFVYDAISRFRLPLPLPQHRVRVGGRERRIDLSYPESMLALEAKGFDRHRERERFDVDALRGNDLRLLEWRVLEFTSAFSDWKIASQVAQALGVTVPPRPRKQLSFSEWMRRRD
jgi:hypothetical protein